MRTWLILVGYLGLPLLATGEEEGSSQRMEKAQQGMAEASWPRKPDNRMSSLSGKMKQVSELSPRFYGQDKEFRAKRTDDWQRDAKVESRGNWESPTARGWEEARWNQVRDWSGETQGAEKFPFSRHLASEKTTTFREVERESAAEWSSRSAATGARADGGLRMYEGRLTRVRDQIRREEQTVRDLGPGRQEMFNPQQVEKLLSQPPKELRGATGQSPAASPHVAAGN